MLGLHASDRLFLYRGVVDFRKGFDGLSGIVRNELKQDPCSGDVFVFLNRNRNRIKLLRWETGGFALYYKRLEEGRIELPKVEKEQDSCLITHTTLLMMIEGISLESRPQRKRFSFA